MAQATNIGWCDISWNSVHGCSIVSTECRNCYAADLSQRYGHTTKPWTPVNAAENVILKPHKLREPLSGAKVWQGLGEAAAAAGKTDGMLVFVNSMSDLFHEQVPEDFIARVFGVMAASPRHTFQILTKRPKRMREILGRSSTDVFWRKVWVDAAEFSTTGVESAPARLVDDHWVLDNVWLGVSIGQRHFVNRADELRATPAAVRFISAEPLIGPLVPGSPPRTTWEEGWEALDLTDIGWLIAGGESGKDRRPMEMNWLCDLHDACRETGTAFFAKQDSALRPGQRGGIPDDDWVQEFPRPRIEWLPTVQETRQHLYEGRLF